MMRAVSSACRSVIVVAKLFQLFQPIGGVGARSGMRPLSGGVIGEVVLVESNQMIPVRLPDVSREGPKEVRILRTPRAFAGRSSESAWALQAMGPLRAARGLLRNRPRIPSSHSGRNYSQGRTTTQSTVMLALCGFAMMS